jgi:hypothetical protein
MFFVKFIRKDLDFLATARAFADKRCQVLKLFKTGAVFRSGHSSLLVTMSDGQWTMNDEQKATTDDEQ